MKCRSRVDFGVLKKETKHPLHKQLYELIRGAIQSGVYLPGDRIEPERWFVKNARLSQPTVARAFRNLARDGWVIRRTGSGTYVNHVQKSEARSLKRVGISYYNIKTPYFERICTGIHAVTQRNKIELALVPTGMDFEHEEKAMKAFEKEKVDGIIVIPFGSESMQRHLLHLLEIGMPIVSIGVHMPRLLCDTVGFDYEQAGYLAAEFLVTQQHRRIAFFCSEVLYPNTANLDMISGIHQACLEFDVPFDDSNIVRAPIMFEDTDNSPPRQALRALFDQPASVRPTALICETDGLALMAYSVIGEIGLKIPQDVSITGGADLPIASQMSPPLTTVTWPLERMGRTALRMLADRANHPERHPVHRILDSQLVVRRSTGIGPNS